MRYFYPLLAIVIAILVVVRPEIGVTTIATGLMVGGILGLLPD